MATEYEDSAPTQPDGLSMAEAALSDAAGRAEAPASNLSIQKGDTILDTYKVESDAIEGGMGSVWRVHHTSWNTDLAMKRPKAELFQTQNQKENFIDESQIRRSFQTQSDTSFHLPVHAALRVFHCHSGIPGKFRCAHHY